MRHISVIIFFILFLLLLPIAAHALEVEVEVSGYSGGESPSLGPANLMDGDPTTAWAGNTVFSDEQWIELHFVEPTQVERLGFYNGHQGGRFELHRRIRSGRVIYPDGKEYRFWLRDQMGEQVVHCPGTPVSSLRIAIDSVSPHKRVDFPGEVAVSGITLYISVHPKPEGVVKDVDGLNRMLENLAQDPERMVPDEVAQLLRMFYHRQTTLAYNYADLFAEGVRDQNDLFFERVKEGMRQRGVYRKLRKADVDTSGLAFEKIEEAGKYMRVRTFGVYFIMVDEKTHKFEEDSIYILANDYGEWKIEHIEDE